LAHGITPSLHHARKRWFRRRVNRRTIESVEQEVERLLEQDALVQEVKYGLSLRHQSQFFLFNDGFEVQTPGGHSERGAGIPGGGATAMKVMKMAKKVRPTVKSMRSSPRSSIAN
jgi:hypothetical protein